MNMKKEIIIWCLLICGLGTTLNAANYYVSTTGSDSSNNGTLGSPWKTVKYGIGNLQAGDTLMIRGGFYREPAIIDNFYSGTESSPITVKSYNGEKVVISGMKDATGTSNWTQVPGSSIYYFNVPLIPPGYIHVQHASQAGVPLKLMTGFTDFGGAAANLTGEGQWSRNRDGHLWVWAKGGGNPGSYNIEYSDSDLSYVIYIVNSVNYITLQDLTIEGGYYPVCVEGDYCIFKNCTFRNCFGDAFKVSDSCAGGWNSEHGQVINCDMYNFGESGIDITGGDYWTVKNCTIHDGIKNRAPSEQPPDGSKLNGIMIKNNSTDVVVDSCRIYNIDGPFGAITIGGNTYYADPSMPPAQNIRVSNNIIHNITGPSYIFAFLGAKDCSFVNNLVYSCVSSQSLIRFLYGLEDHNPPNYTYFNCSGNTVANNIFYSNTTTYNYKEEDDGVHGSNDEDLIINNNIVNGTRNSYFDGAVMSHSTIVSTKGYDTNSLTGSPSFVDYANGLVRLADNSPGIDDGIDLSADVTADYNNTARFLDNAFEIGPFENNCPVTPYSVYSDGSSTTGWANLIPTTVTDSTLNRSVLSFPSVGLGRLLNSSGQSWNNTNQFVITWKAKSTQNHAFAIYLKTKAGVWKTIKYYSWYTTTDFSNPNYLRFPLGAGQAACGDGNWHTYVFDLQAALRLALPADSIDFIDCFYADVSSPEVRLTDIELHSTIQSAKGCIGEWNFNEACGSKVEDTSGKGRHGTLTYMPVTDPLSSVWTMGRITKALQFGGNNSNSYVAIPNLSAVSFTKGLTLSAWVKYDNLTDISKAIASGLTGYVGYPRMYQNSSGIKFQVRMGGNNLVEALSSQNKITAGAWTHVAAVVDMNAKIIKLYINGNEEGSATFTYSSIDGGTYPLYLGSDYFGQFFKGCIDDVKLYNRPLTVEEINVLAE